MADKNLVFFQTLLNDPSVTPLQRKEILKLKKQYMSLGKKFKDSKSGEEISIEDTFTQPANVSRLLSKFGEGKSYGIILFPDKADESAFAKSIVSIQKQLIEEVRTTSIPKTLKALLFLFVLGKYGTCKEWIGAEGKKYSLTCSSKQVKELCQHKHPLHIEETANEFEQFGKAIKVDGHFMNTFLDIVEDEYCKPISLSDDGCDQITEVISKDLQRPLDLEKPLSEQPIQRMMVRANFDNVSFYTNVNILRTALTWFFNIIISRLPLDGKIYVNYEESEEKCSIIVWHDCKIEDDDSGKMMEIVEVMKRMESILKGYAEVTVESDFRYLINGKVIGRRRFYLVKESQLKNEILDNVDDGITYRFNFHKLTNEEK